MQPNWQSLLATFGAILNEHGDALFADAPAQLATFDQDTVIMPLPQYAALAVQGPDSAKFLQGQLTCNVLEVDTTHSTPGAYCTQKGRMLSSFYLAQREGDHYWLRMRSDLLDNTARTLGKYIVFSKAKLLPRDDIAVFGLHGSNAAAIVQSIWGALPSGINSTSVSDDGIVLQRDASGTWFECWLSMAAAANFWQRCRAQCNAASSDYWRWLTIRAGLGEVSAATNELFIPQMLSYELTGAVSFSKGCYTGQEIIARTHYRGQVKRHLLRAQCDGAAPAAGSEVIGANGHVVGNVVDSVAIDAQHIELLAVVSDGDLASGAIQLAHNGNVLRPLALPYAIN